MFIQIDINLCLRRIHKYTSSYRDLKDGTNNQHKKTENKKNMEESWNGILSLSTISSDGGIHTIQIKE